MEGYLLNDTPFKVKYFKGCPFRLLPKELRNRFSTLSKAMLLFRSFWGYYLYYLVDEDGTIYSYCFIKRNYLHKYAFMQSGDLIVNPYYVFQEYRNHGYATIMLKAVLQDPMLKGKNIWAVVVPDNFSSIRVLEKIGFHVLGTVQCKFWSIRRTNDSTGRKLYKW